MKSSPHYDCGFARQNRSSLGDCPGLKPEQILCESFQKSCRNFLRTVAWHSSCQPCDGAVPNVVFATVSDQDAPRVLQTSNEFIRFHNVKELLSLLDDAKVTIKLQSAKCFCNFFVAKMYF